MDWTRDKILVMYKHYQKRDYDRIELLLSPWMKKENKDGEKAKFLTPEDYTNMSPEERKDRQKYMDDYWNIFFTKNKYKE